MGGGDLLYLLCLISNTLPQLEQSSLHPSTVLHHRLLLQTTCYNHLRLFLHLMPRKKRSSNRLGIPSAGRLRSQKGLRPFNPLQKSITTFNQTTCSLFTCFARDTRHLVLVVNVYQSFKYLNNSLGVLLFRNKLYIPILIRYLLILFSESRE